MTGHLFNSTFPGQPW